MNNLNIVSLEDIKNDYDAFLFDIWGVIIEGKKNIGAVVDNINYLSHIKKNVYFVTNAPRSAKFIYNQLIALGINTEINNIFTSGEIAKNILLSPLEKLKMPNPVVYHLAPSTGNNLLDDTNIPTTNTPEKADLLLITAFSDQDKETKKYFKILKNCAKYNITCLCANPDTTFPYPNSIRYCAGYFAELYEHKLNQKVIYTGKPYPEIFNQVLAKIPGIPKNRILMIGDTLVTDIAGANNVGIHSALVLTGNTKKIISDNPQNDENVIKLVKHELQKLKINLNYMLNI